MLMAVTNYLDVLVILLEKEKKKKRGIREILIYLQTEF